MLASLSCKDGIPDRLSGKPGNARSDETRQHEVLRGFGIGMGDAMPLARRWPTREKERIKMNAEMEYAAHGHPGADLGTLGGLEEPPKSTWKAVYTIVDRGNGRKHWLRIGTAFLNRDQSYNVRLDALPLGGQMHIRDSPPRESRSHGGEERY
jgi:hypothetical protein